MSHCCCRAIPVDGYATLWVYCVGMWLLYGFFVASMWFPCGFHVVSMWSLCGFYEAVCGCLVAAMWLLSDSILVSLRWLPYDGRAMMVADRHAEWYLQEVREGRVLFHALADIGTCLRKVLPQVLTECSPTACQSYTSRIAY